MCLLIGNSSSRALWAKTMCGRSSSRRRLQTFDSAARAPVRKRVREVGTFQARETADAAEAGNCGERSLEADDELGLEVCLTCRWVEATGVAMTTFARLEQRAESRSPLRPSRSRPGRSSSGSFVKVHLSPNSAWSVVRTGEARNYLRTSAAPGSSVVGRQDRDAVDEVRGTGPVGLSNEMVDAIALAGGPGKRADLVLRVVNELDDVVRWVTGANSFAELLSLQTLVSAGRRHHSRMTRWAIEGVVAEEDHPPPGDVVTVPLGLDLAAGRDRP